VRSGDLFSLTSATRPADLAALLRLARGRRRVVELGTGTGWTTVSLVVADPKREVVSFDPIDRPERARYVRLVAPEVSKRIEFVTAAGVSGSGGRESIELLYVDSSHECEETIAELRAWSPALAAGALVVLDDYGHSQLTGVRDAVRELGLSGTTAGTMFVHDTGTERLTTQLG
jgi:predicted O-methyltransferase YrrM